MDTPQFNDLVYFCYRNSLKEISETNEDKKPLLEVQYP